MDTSFLSPEQIAGLMPYLTKAAIALGIFMAGWIASKWGGGIALRAFRTAKLDEALARFFSSLVQWAILAFTVIAALDKAGVETTSLAAVIAAAGLAVGLALQGSLANFASGVLLLIFRPFTIGDRVTAAGHVGQVEDVGLFATTLSTPASEKIIIPNAAVTSGSIVNHTEDGRVRLSIAAGVAYGADIDRVCEVLVEAAKSAEHVLDDPAPDAAFVDMASSSLNFLVHCWALPEYLVPMEHNVRRAIYNELNAAGIEIPFDQIVVHKAD